MSSHGYVPYTKGCRCEICKAAKRDYVSRRRKAAWANPQPKVPGILHGARSSYEERGCRCELCTDAKRVDDNVRQYNAYWNRRRAERDAS